MKIQLVVCILFLLVVSQTALTQDDPLEQEVRFAKIEVTLSHLNEAVNNLNGQLATIQLTIFGLFAVFFIPIIALIIQIKTQLGILTKDVNRLENKVDGLDSRVGGLENKVDGLEERVGGLEHKVDGLSITMQKQLNQIRDALAVQLGLVLDPEDEN